MALHITASGAQDIVNDAERIRITVNITLVGTITVTSALGGTVAVITNPTVGNSFLYGGLTGWGKLTINPSATTDLTVTVEPKQ